MKNFLTTGVLVTLALLPAYLLRADIFGIPTTLLEVFLLVLIATWVIQNRKRLKELFVINRQWAIFISLVVLSATISAIIAPDTLSAFGIWKAYFIEPILFFYLLVDLLRKKQITNEKIITALCVGGLLISFAAILQWILWEGIPIPWDIERRVTGLFDYPNALGLFLGPLVIIVIVRLIYKCHCESGLKAGRSNLCVEIATSFRTFCKRCGTHRNDKMLFYLISLILFIIAIILAQSEAALASVVITIVIMGISYKKFRKPMIVISCAALLILFSIPTTRAFLVNKISLQDYSGQVRLSQWKETSELLKDHPIAGVGLSQYPNTLKPYHKDTQYEIFQYPHNIFLNIWVELGLLGLLAFGFFCFLVLHNFTTPRLHDSITFFFPLLQIFIHGLVDVPYFKNDLAVLTWTLLAIFYVTTISSESKK
ncbi:O-antigen ligase family protein [Candidatus Uhrbacteria bacterium]|nr:O-antigen ligase family protein [Candidatus Uhrbacteria bacterium]